jgi:glutamate synthase (NADPH/NADH) small chain
MMKASDFPNYSTPCKIGEVVATFGAGNVAMDCARTALRMGAKKSYIIYRRTEKEMPARIEEVHHAKEEGIIFKILTNPIEFVEGEKGKLKSVKCINMKLGEPDESGRRRPIPIYNSEFTIDIDTALVAIGQNPNPLVPQSIEELETERWGNIKVDDNGKTNIEGVYAGGDIATGAATVILAMGAGKKSARAIDEYLKNK